MSSWDQTTKQRILFSPIFSQFENLKKKKKPGFVVSGLVAYWTNKYFQLFFFAVSIDHDQENESDQNSTFCQHLTSTGSFAAIADLTWGGWDAAKLISAEFGIPYIRIEVCMKKWVEKYKSPVIIVRLRKWILTNNFRFQMHLSWKLLITFCQKEMPWMSLWSFNLRRNLIKAFILLWCITKLGMYITLSILSLLVDSAHQLDTMQDYLCKLGMKPHT